MSMIDPIEDKRSGRSQRMRRLVRLTMDCPRRKDLAITLRNISPRGFGASCLEFAMMVGETVHLQIKGQAALEGEIRWVDGHKFGASFKAVLTEHELVEIVASSVDARAETNWEVSSRHRVVTPAYGTGSLRRL